VVVRLVISIVGITLLVWRSTLVGDLLSFGYEHELVKGELLLLLLSLGGGWLFGGRSAL
jgi:hypothetical protein